MTIQTRTDVSLMSYPPPVRKPIYNTNLAPIWRVARLLKMCENGSLFTEVYKTEHVPTWGKSHNRRMSEASVTT
jgi:hypothetical protein